MDKMIANMNEFLSLDIAEPNLDRQLSDEEMRDIEMSQAYNKRARRERGSAQKADYKKHKSYYDAIADVE